MLAPRNKLWSTPLSVIDEAISALEITSSDIVFDIGAGDGRFLVLVLNSVETNNHNQFVLDSMW